jgi:hypothetical protein
MSVFAVQPAAPQPAPDAETLSQLRAMMSFGAIKAVIGSEHPFRRKTTEEIPVQGLKDKDNKPKVVRVEREETYFRAVRSIHQWRHIPHRWIALGTTIVADTEEECIAMVHATYGGPEAMRRAGQRIVYCAETLTEIDVHVSEGGRPAIKRETALLSDREPG